MKRKINYAAVSVILLLPFFSLGCGALNKNSDALTINQTIAAQSKLLIELEDKSGFHLDIENQSNDTLVLERKGLDNLMITRASVKAIIEPEASASLVNASNWGAKVRVRVSNHKSKVVQRIEPAKADSTVAR